MSILSKEISPECFPLFTGIYNFWHFLKKKVFVMSPKIYFLTFFSRTLELTSFKSQSQNNSLLNFCKTSIFINACFWHFVILNCNFVYNQSLCWEKSRLDLCTFSMFLSKFKNQRFLNLIYLMNGSKQMFSFN